MNSISKKLMTIQSLCVILFMVYVKKDLNITLLSDESTTMLQEYGIWQLKNKYGKEYMGTFRTTFIINEEGIVENIITPKEVKTKEHAFQILNL